ARLVAVHEPDLRGAQPRLLLELAQRRLERRLIRVHAALGELPQRPLRQAREDQEESAAAVRAPEHDHAGRTISTVAHRPAAPPFAEKGSPAEGGLSAGGVE